MEDQADQTVARKILYVLVEEQRMHPGAGLSSQVLSRDLTRHGMSASEQKDGIALAIQNGWLQTGLEDELQLTDKGFNINFGQ